MKMTRAAAALGLSAILSAGSGAAWANGGFYAEARVLGTEPVYRTVTVNRPEERCWNEEVYRRGPRGPHYSYTPTITGGIIGGLIGNQLGEGSGRPWPRRSAWIRPRCWSGTWPRRPGWGGSAATAT